MEVLSSSLQENLLVLLVFDSKTIPVIINNVRLEHFENPYYRMIASQAMNFYKEFNDCVGDHIGDLLEDILNEDSKRAEILKKVLKSIYELRTSVKVEFVLKSLKRFVLAQELKLKLKLSAEQLQEGKVEEAYDTIESVKYKELNLFDPGVFFGVDPRTYTFNEVLDDAFIYTGIEALDNLELIPTKKEMYCLMARSGMGKAQSLDSVIYTPTGSKYMGDINVGDVVFNLEGKPTEVIQTHPQGKKEIYKVTFYDGSSTKVTKDHLWESWIVGKGNRQVRTTEEIKRLIDIEKKHVLIPLSAPVEFEEKDVKIHPYLLGVILGDGGLTKKTDFTITKKETEIITRIKTLLPDNTKLSKRKAIYNYSIIKSSGGINPMLEYLREYGLLNISCENKNIPKDYLINSISNRTEILRGLLDTDGYIDKKGGIYFTSKSEKLVDDVIFLVQSLGGTATKKPKIVSIRDKEGKFKYYKTYFNSFIRIKDSYKYFFLKRKADRSKPYNGGNSELARRIKLIEYVGEEEAKCITIKDERGLYLTDNFIVTHNSWFLTYLGKMALLQRKKVLHITLELSEDRLKTRYFQCLFGLPTRLEDYQSRIPLFEVDDYGAMSRINFKDLPYPKTLKDESIITELAERMSYFHNPQLLIKEFPSGSLSIEGLKAYLENIIAFYNFNPDIILLDYLDLMDIDVEKMRIDLASTAVALRGMASTYDTAMVTVAQTNRVAEGVALITRKHLGEDFSKVKTVDNLITYNQTPFEEKHGLARLYVDKGRNGRRGDIILISQNYSAGQFCLSSCLISKKYYGFINENKGEKEDE
jgi:replicative DNA helicase